ncbi:hypothetical protein ACFROC_29180 [Nocardia tengchongensis]|uniref:hypothetical protein n=1 Tax=Nocardia tengchongensis TaxID=2055889 RepID=UPI0036B38741
MATITTGRARWTLGRRTTTPAPARSRTAQARRAEAQAHAAAEALALLLGTEAAEVAEAAVLAVDAAGRGNAIRMVAALLALRDRTDIAIGALTPAAREGASVPAEDAAGALSRALNTSLFTAALYGGMENPR